MKIDESAILVAYENATKGRQKMENVKSDCEIDLDSIEFVEFIVEIEQMFELDLSDYLVMIRRCKNIGELRLFLRKTLAEE